MMAIVKTLARLVLGLAAASAMSAAIVVMREIGLPIPDTLLLFAAFVGGFVIAARRAEFWVMVLLAIVYFPAAYVLMWYWGIWAQNSVR